MTTAQNNRTGLQLLSQSFDLVILDIKTPRVNGIDVLKKAVQRSPDAQIIVLTAFPSIDTAIAALRAKTGAWRTVKPE